MATVSPVTRVPSAPEKPPFPLPDLPRLVPPTELGLIALRVLEWRDMEALTRLPDKLRDAGLNADADYIQEALARELYFLPQNSAHFETVWEEFAPELARIVWWHIFSWEGTLAQMGRAFAPIEVIGTVAVGGKTVGTGTLTIPPFGASAWAGTALADATVTVVGDFEPSHDADDLDDLHARELHPDFEYATTFGTGAPEGDGHAWYRNRDHESSPKHYLGGFHWMRRKA